MNGRLALNDFWFTYLNSWSDDVKFYSLLKGIGRAFALSYLLQILMTIWHYSREALESPTRLKTACWARFLIHFLLVLKLDWLILDPDLTRQLILFLRLSYCHLKILHCRSHYLLLAILLQSLPPLLFFFLFITIKFLRSFWKMA